MEKEKVSRADEYVEWMNDAFLEWRVRAEWKNEKGMRVVRMLILNGQCLSEFEWIVSMLSESEGDAWT